MKIWKLTVALAFVALAYGCSSLKSHAFKSKTTSSPEGVIISLLEATKTDDHNSAKKLCHPSFLDELETRSGFHDFFAKGHSKFQELKNYKITSIASSEKDAKYRVDYTFSDDKREYDIISLKHDHDAWLVTDI